MGWRSLDELIEETERDDNAGRGIWNRDDIDPHTAKARHLEYLASVERRRREREDPDRETQATAK